jgi:riboflavin kinase/FMN adenylyltransferase
MPCAVVPEQTVDGERVSSTRIRTLIEEGKMGEANKLLGHPHVLTGTVVRGKQLGRTIGIPTANLLLPEELVVPKFGVYACRCLVEDKRYGAVTNVGTRPTVAGVGVTVETWILGYEGDLYDREITLEFLKFLRPEIKFPSLGDLQEAVRADGEKTKEILKTFSALQWD